MIKKLVLLVILAGCWSLVLADTKTLTISDLLIQSGTEEQLETGVAAI